MTKDLRGKDLIDSRAVIARIVDLQAIVDADEDLGDGPLHGCVEELRDLQTLEKAASSRVGNWQHGATLINDSYFETYARDFAEDVYGSATNNFKGWPFDHIDWERAADALKADFTSVKFGDDTYWMQS